MCIYIHSRGRCCEMIQHACVNAYLPCHRYLTLDDNQLTSVPEGVFHGLTSLGYV